MQKQPSELTERSWARLKKVQRLLLTSVEKTLKEAGFPSLSWYDVLLELERCGPFRPASRGA